MPTTGTPSLEGEDILAFSLEHGMNPVIPAITPLSPVDHAKVPMCCITNHLKWNE